MSWKMHDTDDVFAALRGLCSNSYRMYDPCEHRYYYDHDCETYGCAVEDAAREYERLLRHCDHQRQELAKLHHPIEGEVMNERTKTEQGSSRFEQGSSITGELRRYADNWDGWFYDDKDGGLIHAIGHDPIQSTPVPRVINRIADRIDERHAKACGKAYDEGVCDGIDADKNAMGYIKAPVDADGIPIKMGDEMELTDEAARRWDGDKHFGKVMGLELTVDGWTVEGDPATDLRHVKPDSWESIIEDAISECGWEQPKEYEIDFEDSREARNRFVAELVERCRRLAGE